MSRVSARIFEPGGLCTPIAGTTAWKDGKAAGTWGDPDNPVRLHVIERNGTVRPTTRAERRLIRRMWPHLAKGVRNE
mgnify:FL=1|jgi:hypothetical protein